MTAEIQVGTPCKRCVGHVYGEENSLQDTSADAVKKSYSVRKDIDLNCILLSIDDNCVGSTADMVDPSRVWMTLEVMYQRVSKSIVDALMERFQSIPMAVSESVI